MDKEIQKISIVQSPPAVSPPRTPSCQEDLPHLPVYQELYGNETVPVYNTQNWPLITPSQTNGRIPNLSVNFIQNDSGCHKICRENLDKALKEAKILKTLGDEEKKCLIEKLAIKEDEMMKILIELNETNTRLNSTKSKLYEEINKRQLEEIKRFQLEEECKKFKEELTQIEVELEKIKANRYGKESHALAEEEKWMKIQRVLDEKIIELEKMKENLCDEKEKRILAAKECMRFQDMLVQNEVELEKITGRVQDEENLRVQVEEKCVEIENLLAQKIVEIETIKDKRQKEVFQRQEELNRHIQAEKLILDLQEQLQREKNRISSSLSPSKSYTSAEKCIQVDENIESTSSKAVVLDDKEASQLEMITINCDLCGVVVDNRTKYQKDHCSLCKELKKIRNDDIRLHTQSHHMDYKIHCSINPKCTFYGNLNDSIKHLSKKHENEKNPEDYVLDQLINGSFFKSRDSASKSNKTKRTHHHDKNSQLHDRMSNAKHEESRKKFCPHR